MIPELTAAAGAPRTAAVAYPMGRPLGRPGDVAGQREVLLTALRVLETATVPGTVVTLPFTWPEPAKEVRRAHIGDPPPIGTLIRKKPWLYFRLLSGDIPENGDDRRHGTKR
jgi:hypothetical protein